MSTYTHEPLWDDPHKELETELNVYRDLVRRLKIFDQMEVIAYLPARDGIAWALEQLDGKVDKRTLNEIARLDAELRANADYLVNELDVYYDLWRDEPKENWWWYLDGGDPHPYVPSIEERYAYTLQAEAALKVGLPEPEPAWEEKLKDFRAQQAIKVAATKARLRAEAQKRAELPPKPRARIIHPRVTAKPARKVAEARAKYRARSSPRKKAKR
jgi:hypothetical protein